MNAPVSRRSIVLAASLGAAATALVAEPPKVVAKVVEAPKSEPAQQPRRLRILVDVTDKEKWIVWRDNKEFLLRDGEAVWLIYGDILTDKFVVCSGGATPPQIVHYCYDFEMFSRADVEADATT